MKTVYSNGKLLLTGEYVVLDGALSLAIPTKYGQSLTIEEIDQPKLIWQSLDEKGNVWFQDTFQIKDNKISNTVKNNDSISQRLVQILNAAKLLNSKFLHSHNGFKVTTKIDFPRNWGLGSSSTLINNIAKWANVDAYLLLENTFGGSGYDIACAQHNTPITYQIKNGKPKVQRVKFNPIFKDCLYFVHLNNKQNSRDAIKHYQENKVAFSITEIDTITNKIMHSKTLEDFENLINTHETYISKITKQKPIKQLLFNDFNGSVKSLGAWGGDFVLVTSQTNPKAYFKNNGFKTIISYDEMALF